MQICGNIDSWFMNPLLLATWKSSHPHEGESQREKSNLHGVQIRQFCRNSLQDQVVSFDMSTTLELMKIVCINLLGKSGFVAANVSMLITTLTI